MLSCTLYQLKFYYCHLMALNCANRLLIRVRLNRKSLASVMKNIRLSQIENMILKRNVNKNSQGGLSFKLTVKECMYTCEGRKKPSGGREKDQKKMF